MNKILSFLIFSSFYISSCTQAQSVTFYEGNLLLPTKDSLLIVLEIEKNNANTFTGYLTMPRHGQSRLKLNECSISGDSIFFKYSRFNTEFKGKYSSLGIEGVYSADEDYPVVFNQVNILERRPQTPQPPFTYLTKEISYYSRDGLVKYGGTLTLSDEKGKFPAIILLTGSGEQDRDETIFYHKPFLVIADYLTKRGFAVLRLDDRGVGGTTGGDMSNTTSDYANDALEAVNFIKQHKNIDSSSIGFIGHSEGGLIAFLAASRKPSDIAFIVSLASPAASGKELALKQLGQGLLAQGKDSTAVNDVLKFWDKSFDIINETDTRSGSVELALAITRVFKEWSMEHKNSPKSLELMGFDFNNLDNDVLLDKFLKSKMIVYLTPWHRYILSYNPRQILKKVKMPILALNGDKDENVDAEINLSRFKILSEELGIPIDIVKLKNVNHFLQTSTNGSIAKVYENPETISPEILTIIHEWLDKNK